MNCCCCESPKRDLINKQNEEKLHCEFKFNTISVKQTKYTLKSQKGDLPILGFAFLDKTRKPIHSPCKYS